MNRNWLYTLCCVPAICLGMENQLRQAIAANDPFLVEKILTDRQTTSAHARSSSPLNGYLTQDALAQLVSMAQDEHATAAGRTQTRLNQCVFQRLGITAIAGGWAATQGASFYAEHDEYKNANTRVMPILQLTGNVIIFGAIALYQLWQGYKNNDAKQEYFKAKRIHEILLTLADEQEGV